MTLTPKQKAQLAELERLVDVSKRVQKQRKDAKNIAWKAYVVTRTRYRTRKQITEARELKLKKFKETHRGGGAKKACAWALDQIGTVEQPAFSNRGPKIDIWEKATLGYSGYPWCQAFVNYSLVRAGGPQLTSAYTPQVVQWANEKRYGLQRVSTPRPGDWVYFKFPGVSSAFCDHVALYVGDGKTVEGNTSSGAQGSQNNGGGVYLRQRGTATVVAYVRPPYPA